MQTDAIRIEIEEQISILNEALDSFYWNYLYKKQLLDDDIELLEKILKKAVMRFKTHKVIGIFLSGFTLISSVNTNQGTGILLIFLLFTLNNVYRYYKVMANLHTKINLLWLLEKVDQA